MMKSKEEKLFKAYNNLVEQYNQVVANIYEDLETYVEAESRTTGTVKTISSSKLLWKLRTNKFQILQILKKAQEIH